jgi:hypothetical protein
MKRALPRVIAALLSLAGIGLLFLTNTGLLSLDKAYFCRFSAGLPATVHQRGQLKDSFEPSLLERLWPLTLPALAALVVVKSAGNEQPQSYSNKGGLP